jgi:hypothetical protein
MRGHRHASAALPTGKDPGIHFAGGLVDRTERVRKIWYRSLDRLIRSELLDRLRYPGAGTECGTYSNTEL